MKVTKFNDSIQINIKYIDIMYILVLYTCFGFMPIPLLFLMSILS